MAVAPASNPQEVPTTPRPTGEWIPLSADSGAGASSTCQPAGAFDARSQLSHTANFPNSSTRLLPVSSSAFNNLGSQQRNKRKHLIRAQSPFDDIIVSFKRSLLHPGPKPLTATFSVLLESAACRSELVLHCQFLFHLYHDGILMIVQSQMTPFHR